MGEPVVTGVGIVAMLVAMVWVHAVAPQLNLQDCPSWQAGRRLLWALRGLSWLLAAATCWELWEWWLSGWAGPGGLFVALFGFYAWKAWPPAAIELRVGDLRARADAIEDRTEWGT